jgi:hypothetical protein
MKRTLGDLRNDRSGAVMVIGLFMAMFLIGAMWTVVGIGDAIVFRDRAQEAADHIAFTAATVHARGMNFIAALNLVMLAIVAVWLVVDAIDKILNFLRFASMPICYDPYTAEVGCPVMEFAEEAYEAFHPFHESYKEGMQPVLIGLSWAQTATGMLAPYGGMASSLEVSAEYKMPGLGVSISMLPEFAIAGGLKNGSYDWSSLAETDPAHVASTKVSSYGALGQRIGLPVQNQKMNRLCIYSADYVLDWIMAWLGKIPVAGLVFQIPTFQGFVKNVAGSAVAEASCNEYVDGFWGRDGPKTVYGPGQSLEHGQDDYHQVYGFVYATETDVSENKVAFGIGPKGFGRTNPTTSHFYVAQTEFFFDCDKEWTDLDCNGPGNLVDIPRSLYSMRWMVRMRRVHYPSVGQLLTTWLANNIVMGNVLGPLKGKIAQSDWFKNVQGKLGGVAGQLGGDKGEAIAKDMFGGLVKTGNGPSALDNAVEHVLGGVEDKLDKKFPGAFHSPPTGGIVH